MKKYLKIILDLFYPRICHACKEPLQAAEQHICISCLLTLPKSNSHIIATDLINRKFWGKINVKNTYSYLRFNKKGKVQNILHALKYKNKPELAEYIGKVYGKELLDINFDKEIDLIVGVPLHKDKKHIRGYNQADCFAEGLSGALNVPFSTTVIIRNTFTETQTKMSNRFGRFKNIDGVFDVINPNLVKNKRIALVDDILTTGSTLEVAGATLLKYGCAELHIITIASAY